jgi:hypothetical protein
MQFIRSFHTGPWLPAEDELLMQALPGAPLTRQAFAVSSPPNWRRVSHLLQRFVLLRQLRLVHLQLVQQVGRAVFRLGTRHNMNRKPGAGFMRQTSPACVRVTHRQLLSRTSARLNSS